jgi:tellurite resistance protein TerC
MIAQIAPWILFILFIVGALLLDLKILHSKERDVPIRLALKMTTFWVSLAMIFCAGVYYFEGSEKALLFLTGYLIEESLSVDNLFVFLLIFSYFQIPGKYQPRVLFLGILGAIVLRLTFILVGVALIQKFHWMIYLFGVFLIYTGSKLAFQGDIKVEPEKNPILKIFRKMMPVQTEFEGQKFLIKREGKYIATPLLVALIMIETTDVIFAVDSIPAIMSITLDPFIIYTSNIFAILGLRSIFFALAGLMRIFHYLNYGLSIILVFLGIKMTLSGIFHIPVLFSLGFIAFLLLSCIVISIIAPPKQIKSDEEED